MGKEAELALGRAQLVEERAQLTRAEGGREAQFAREREEVDGRRRDVERRGEERVEVAGGEDQRLSGGETVGKTVWLSFLIASGRRRFVWWYSLGIISLAQSVRASRRALRPEAFFATESTPHLGPKDF